MEWVTVISVLGVISAVVVAWSNLIKTIKKSIKEGASSETEMKTDVEYIKRGVDEMRLEQKDQGRRFDALSERVTRVEESTKQAHHRINRMEGRGKV